MHENSGSQFFRTSTGIQSEPDAFEHPWFVLIFLINLVVLRIFYIFTLVLEGKAGKTPVSSRLDLIEKFVRCRKKKETSAPLNKEGIADLSRKVSGK